MHTLCKSSGKTETPNRYISSNVNKSNEIDRHVYNSHNYRQLKYDYRGGRYNFIYDRPNNLDGHTRNETSPGHKTYSDDVQMRETCRQTSPIRRRHSDEIHTTETYERINLPSRWQPVDPNSVEAYERNRPMSRRQFENSHDVESYDPCQKRKIHRSSSCSKVDSYLQKSISPAHDYYSKNSITHQPAYCSLEHSHHNPIYCSMNGNNSNNNAETETVKNLLYVITSQNEQIKYLQKQVERLLKLHEQSFKDRNECKCQPNGIVYQNAKVYDQSRTAN